MVVLYRVDYIMFVQQLFKNPKKDSQIKAMRLPRVRLRTNWIQ